MMRLPRPIIETHVPLRSVVLFGGVVSFFLCVAAGAAALAGRAMYDTWPWAPAHDGGFFARFGIGAIAGWYVLVMLIYAALFFVPRRQAAVLAALVVTGASGFLLISVLLAHWRPLINLLGNGLVGG